MDNVNPRGFPALFLYCALAQRQELSLRQALDMYRGYGGKIRTETFSNLWKLSADAPAVFGVAGIGRDAA